MPTDAHPTLGHREPNKSGFRRRIGAGFGGLSALYAVYAVGAFVALEPGASIPYRLVLILGMAAFPLTVLLAPAVFVAALDDFDLYGTAGPDVRRGHWRLVGLVAMGAGLASAVGPDLFDHALAAVGYTDHVRVPREGMIVDANARLMIPLAVALLVVVAGLSGAVVGRLTTALADAPRIFTRWVAGVLLIAVFWTTMVVIAELIAMHGMLSPIWLALAPPMVPLLLTCILARDDCARLARSLIDRIRYRHERMDPLILDDLVTAIQRATDPDETAASPLAHNDPDPEMAELLARLHRLEGPREAADESRVREIVNALTAPSPHVVRVAPRRPDARPTPGRLQTAGRGGRMLGVFVVRAPAAGWRRHRAGNHRVGIHRRGARGLGYGAHRVPRQDQRSLFSTGLISV